MHRLSNNKINTSSSTIIAFTTRVNTDTGSMIVKALVAADQSYTILQTVYSETQVVAARNAAKDDLLG